MPEKANAFISFSDNFDQGLSHWSVVKNEQWFEPTLPCYNFSSPAQWNIHNQSLYIEITGSPCITEIIPQIQNAQYIDSYEFSFDVTFPESMNMDRNYLLKKSDNTNWYGMKIINDAFYLEKVVDGIGYSVSNASTYYPFEVNKTYRIKNIVEQNHIRIYIDDSLVLNFMDTYPFLTQGIPGFRASVGSIPRSVTSFDNVTYLELPSDYSLTVPYTSQKDLKWKDQVYDRADSWYSQDPSIQRWGCALTSAVMMLHFYNIFNFVDGTPITPLTLNSWLISQQDGYVGNGLLNWLAISRLSKQVSETYNTYALEFFSTINKSSAIAHLYNGNPIIVKLPTHYVIATGYLVSQDAFLIHDPYDKDNTILSDTQNIQSYRLFTPSNTDLSYLMFVHDNQTNITVSDPSISTFSIDEGPYAENGDSKTVTYIQKPEKEKYEINVSYLSQSKHIIEMFIYRSDGAYVPYHFESTGVSSEQFNVSVTENTISFKTSDSLINDIQVLWKQGHITSAQVYRFLLRISSIFVETSSQRYISLLKFIIKSNFSFLSQHAIAVLEKYFVHM